MLFLNLCKLQGCHLAVGTYRGHVQIWDVTKTTCLRSLNGHIARVGALAWNVDLLASGSRDRYILLRDTRASASTGGGPGSSMVTTPHHTTSSAVSTSIDEPMTPRLEHFARNNNLLPTEPMVDTGDVIMEEDEEDEEDYAPRTAYQPANNGSSPVLGGHTEDFVAARTAGYSSHWDVPFSPLSSTNTTANTPAQLTPHPDIGVDRSIPGVVRVLKDHRQEVSEAPHSVCLFGDNRSSIDVICCYQSCLCHTSIGTQSRDCCHRNQRCLRVYHDAINHYGHLGCTKCFFHSELDCHVYKNFKNKDRIVRLTANFVVRGSNYAGCFLIYRTNASPKIRSTLKS